MYNAVPTVALNMLSSLWLLDADDHAVAKEPDGLIVYIIS
jgi:hypothetical protein